MDTADGEAALGEWMGGLGILGAVEAEGALADVTSAIEATMAGLLEAKQPAVLAALALFLSVDVNHDGRVTETEFARLATSELPKLQGDSRGTSFSHEQLQRTFAKADLNAAMKDAAGKMATFSKKASDSHAAAATDRAALAATGRVRRHVQRQRRHRGGV